MDYDLGHAMMKGGPETWEYIRFAHRNILSMFLTLGNFEVDPRACLAVVDFDRARVVSFSGLARLRFTGELPGHPTGGTGRYWELVVREWVEFDLPPAMRWDFLDSSPFNPSCPPRS